MVFASETSMYGGLLLVVHVHQALVPRASDSCPPLAVRHGAVQVEARRLDRPAPASACRPRPPLAHAAHYAKIRFAQAVEDGPVEREPTARSSNAAKPAAFEYW
jgi:hypothetical protein